MNERKMEYSNESKLNLKFSTTTTTSNDNENDFTITPPLSHDEQIIINERMAIVGSENVDIIINDDDNVNNGCDNHHHQNHGNNIDDLDDDDDKHYNKWIYCIAIVNFDIEIGQSIEVNEKKNLLLINLFLFSSVYSVYILNMLNSLKKR